MKTLTKNTHISHVRQLNQNTSEQICELLQWDWERFCRHQYDCYEAFIEFYCELLPKAKELLRHSPVFSGWFKNEWAKRNEREFLSFAIGLTQEEWTVNDDGKLEIFEAVQLGDPYLIDEYFNINCPSCFYSDDEFGLKYSVIVEEILRAKAWKH